MTDLERRVEEYMKNHFCKKVDKEYMYMIEECEKGERIRCLEYEVRKEMIVDFAQQETDILSKHIVELQKDKGILNDEVNIMQQRFIDTSNGWRDKCKQLEDQLTEAKEIIRTFLNIPMPNNEEVFADVGAFLSKAEAFINKE